MNAVLDHLLDTLAVSPWTYALLLAFAAFDVIVPLIPSESAVILAGVLAAAGDLEMPAVIVAAATGAVIGDHVAYGIGRGVGTRIRDRFARGKRARHRLAWAEHQLGERGGGVILTARFIPGGRSAATLAAGTLEMPWRRFFGFDVVAGVVWASFAALLGYFGGQAFEDDPGLALLVAFVVVAMATVSVESVRSWRARRTHRLGAVD